MTRVLAFTKYGREAASTRQRLLQFVPTLERAGFAIDFRPLLSDDYVRSLASGSPRPMTSIAVRYGKRLAELWAMRRFDLLWVYAELFPGLPAMFERAAQLSGTPYIYDCDDAFFHGHDRHRLLRDKLRPLIEGAAGVSAGNAYLADYARRWNENVTIIPTVVNTEVYLPCPTGNAVPVIGWIGSPSTWTYVRPLLPMLRDLCAGGRAQFLAVGAGQAASTDCFEGMEFRDWAEEREVADVQEMDIGIMPLPDEPWARGKCGYKLIQYMACGLPTVASPIGVNSTIVDHRTGILAGDSFEWRAALDCLLANPGLRASMGAAGRTKSVEQYSLASQAPMIVDLFRDAAGRAVRSPVR